MSRKNKSKRRAAKRGRDGSHSRPRSRHSTSRRVISCGRETDGYGKSEHEQNERGKPDEPGIAGAPPEKKRRKRLKKRVPMGEALRKQGLDEHTVAERYANVVSRLEKNPSNVGSGDKLLVEILKECTRQIEAAQPVGEGGVQVQLVHSVERPARKPTPTAETEAESEK